MKKEETKLKITLADYYESLPSATAPKTEFVNKVIERCHVTQQATRRWIKNGTMPSSKEHCDIVGEIAGISPESLFPLYKEKFLNNKNIEPSKDIDDLMLDLELEPFLDKN